MSEEYFRFLDELADATRSLADSEQIMAVMARMLGSHLRASRCAYADVDEDGQHFSILHDYTDGCASTVGNYELSFFGSRAVALLHAGENLILRDIDAELAPADGAEMFNSIGIKAIITCPLVKQGGLRAMMAVHQSTPRDWLKREIDLVEEVVERCWATIERRRAEEALLKSERRFTAIFEQAAVGVAQVETSTGRYLNVNRRFCEIFGYRREDIAALNALDLISPPEAGLYEFTAEKRALRGGAEVWANVTVSRVETEDGADFSMVIVQDITRSKLLEEQMRQAQKLDAIGTLAGGIAHDFNNILTAINGNLELARLKLTGNQEVAQYLDSVLKASHRATDLVRQIMAFSRQQPRELRPVHLLSIVDEAFRLLRATIPSTVTIELHLSPEAPTVLADATQIHQVLMNLGTNAWHAMKDGPGRLEVRLEKHDIAGKAYARVSVSDDGTGMDEATLFRIFEPFFTTKGPGGGTGLGLAVVHGIMETHHGMVTVNSRPGEGTTFQLDFPACAAEEVAGSAEEKPLPRGKGQSILFVDDEAALVEVGQRILHELGYRVRGTTVAAQALAWLCADPRLYDLVITDQTMPGMTGVQLAGEIHKLRADLPLILMTGYSAALTPEQIAELGIRRLLHKPAGVHTLATAVKEALGS